MQRCARCQHRLDLPAPDNCPDPGAHTEADLALSVVEAIETDINTRPRLAGFMAQIDADTLEDIRARWAELARDVLRSSEEDQDEEG